MRPDSSQNQAYSARPGNSYSHIRRIHHSYVKRLRSIHRSRYISFCRFINLQSAFNITVCKYPIDVKFNGFKGYFTLTDLEAFWSLGDFPYGHASNLTHVVQSGPFADYVPPPLPHYNRCQVTSNRSVSYYMVSDVVSTSSTTVAYPTSQHVGDIDLANVLDDRSW